jgi:hypothetical protein
MPNLPINYWIQPEFLTQSRGSGFFVCNYNYNWFAFVGTICQRNGSAVGFTLHARMANRVFLFLAFMPTLWMLLLLSSKSKRFVEILIWYRYKYKLIYDVVFELKSGWCLLNKISPTSAGCKYNPVSILQNGMKKHNWLQSTILDLSGDRGNLSNGIFRI